MRVIWVNNAWYRTLKSHILSFGKWPVIVLKVVLAQNLKISVNFSQAMAQEQVNSSTQTLACSACIIVTWILSKCNSQIHSWIFGFLQISLYNFFDSRMVNIHYMFTEGYCKYHLRSCLTAVLFLCCMSGHRNLSRCDCKMLLTRICINFFGFIWLLHFM